MASQLSTAPTLTPSDSASQVPAPAAKENAPPRKGGDRKSPKAPRGKNAPPGAVDVPPPGEKKTQKKSPVVSATIPISGWGETDLHEFRRDIRPEFTTDASPYFDLVDKTYSLMQSRYSSASKHVPRALFIYYCLQLWWLRALWLSKGNANVLTTEEKRFLNLISAGEEFMIPAPIAQYLANMGNFQQGGETYYYVRPPVMFDGTWDQGNVEKGWLSTQTGITVSGGREYWLYAQVPVPGVYTQAVQMEANHTLPAPLPRQTLSHVAPIRDGYAVLPTANIIGWRNTDYDMHHSSWRSTYSSLGWSNNSLPTDMQTVFNFSASTMKWVSERLGTVKDLKSYSSNQLTLSSQGSPIQAYYLDNTIPASQMPHFAYSPNFVDNWKGTLNSDLCLNSRFAFDSKMLSPAFSFGYRINRVPCFRRYVQQSPEYYSRTNYDPWIFFDNVNAPRAPPTGWEAFRNATFGYGSQAFINVPRFGTAELNRSVGMDAALILAA
jgi:hypothetical protein